MRLIELEDSILEIIGLEETPEYFLQYLVSSLGKEV